MRSRGMGLLLLTVVVAATAVPVWATGRCTFRDITCYADSAERRVLPHRAAQWGHLNPLTSPRGSMHEACGLRCASSHHIYYGLENGDECWCGSKLPDWIKPAADAGAACNMACNRYDGTSNLEAATVGIDYDHPVVCGGHKAISIAKVRCNVAADVGDVPDPKKGMLPPLPQPRRPPAPLPPPPPQPSNPCTRHPIDTSRSSSGSVVTGVSSPRAQCLQDKRARELSYFHDERTKGTGSMFLHYVHMPKCGGTTTSTVLREVACAINPTVNTDCCTNPGWCETHYNRGCKVLGFL
jgi:hypothetical protein